MSDLTRWSCESYCLCGSRRGHFEQSADGVWVSYEHAAARLARLTRESDRLRGLLREASLEIDELMSYAPASHEPRIKAKLSRIDSALAGAADQPTAALASQQTEMSYAEKAALYGNLPELHVSTTAPAPAPQPSATPDLRDRITAILVAYRCQYTGIDGEEHEGLPLFDALTPPGAQTVELGKCEIELLADELAAELRAADNAPAPAPQPSVAHDKDCEYLNRTSWPAVPCKCEERSKRPADNGTPASQE